VRIDRSDPSEGPGDAPAAPRARSALDKPDAATRDRGTAVSGGGPPDSPHASVDATLRAERVAAFRARVDAAYRQHAIDHGDAQVETVKHKTATPAVSRIDAQDPQRHLFDQPERLKVRGQPAEAARKTPEATDGTSAVARDGPTPADNDNGMRNLAIGQSGRELYAVTADTFGDSPATATGGDGSIGGGDEQPPAGDTSPDPEGDDPEEVNGGLGELVRVNAKDRAADLLAERIGGEASVRFANGPANELDAVSSDYVAQAKPANFTLNQAFRNQAKSTFEVAIQSGRTPYFQFDGPPGLGVLQTLSRYAERYGIEPVIDLTPLGETDA